MERERYPLYKQLPIENRLPFNWVVSVRVRVRKNMFKFQTLDVWKKSVEFADTMIEIAEQLPQKYQYSLGDQLRRAGLSVPNNVAEGNGRKSKKESGNFYNIAKGSLYECVNILVILSKRKLVDWSKFHREVIYKLAEDVAKMLTGLMR